MLAWVRYVNTYPLYVLAWLIRGSAVSACVIVNLIFVYHFCRLMTIKVMMIDANSIDQHVFICTKSACKDDRSKLENWHFLYLQNDAELKEPTNSFTKPFWIILKNLIVSELWKWNDVHEKFWDLKLKFTEG